MIHMDLSEADVTVLTLSLPVLRTIAEADLKFQHEEATLVDEAEAVRRISEACVEKASDPPAVKDLKASLRGGLEDYFDFSEWCACPEQKTAYVMQGLHPKYVRCPF